MSEDVQHTARTVSDFVNRSGRADADALAEAMAQDHRTLVQLKATVFIKFFRILAEDHKQGWFDERNAEACKRATIMMKALEDAGIETDSMPFI